MANFDCTICRFHPRLVSYRVVSKFTDGNYILEECPSWAIDFFEWEEEEIGKLVSQGKLHHPCDNCVGYPTPDACIGCACVSCAHPEFLDYYCPY